MKKLLPTLSLLLAITYVQAQQIIVQIEETADMASLLQRFERHTTISIPVTVQKQLSKSPNIWLLEQSGNTKFLNLLQKEPTVIAVQKNLPVQQRATPDDHLLAQQWQYCNNSANEGILDADIDAPEAWDITTGGITSTGDEIVVAIIDGGINPEHPDLATNIWTNRQEIPDNGIDDDQNGYIDDYYGWNFNADNNDVTNRGYGHWHGSAVAGIIGAEGNNGIGVSGINWKVKLLNLIGNSDDAGIISAYAYIIDLRRKYNDSNGTEGAFIVATNASFGRNFGHPEDSPIWCGMYDSLGEVGILSVGATANLDIDVDVVGDLPTTCPSPYLISVTNTTKKDQKEQAAAYGSTNIDLGAPGAESFTVNNADDYGLFGGTSAAAPHVAGAIALCYAIDSKPFMSAVYQRPAQTAQLIKAYILGGTDEIDDLQNRSTSGGRLNLHNTLRLLLRHYAIPNQPKSENSITASYRNGIVQANFQLKTQSDVRINLYNTIGQQFHQTNLTQLDDGSHKILLQTKELPSGMYIVNMQVKASQTNISYKVLVIN